MEDSRPLNEEKDIVFIKNQLRKPLNIDDDLFNDFVSILISNRSEEIIGVETDHRVKSILADREKREKERLARVTVRLSNQEIKDSYFPSERKEALPKFIKLDEIDAYRMEWVNRLQKEINDYFHFKDDDSTRSKIEDDLRKIFSDIDIADNSTKKPKINQSHSSQLASVIASNEIPDGNQYQSLLKILTQKILDGADLQNVIFTINHFKEETRHLTQSELDRILNFISFAEYYKGGKDYDRDPKGSRMLSSVDQVNQRQIKRDIANQLMVMKFHPYLIEEYIEHFKLRFQRSLSLEGKYCGNAMASAISETSTQQTLNTFHSSGDRKGRSQITGFQKLMSHLEASDNPSGVINIIFTKKSMSEEEMFLNISKFEYTVFSNLIKKYRLLKVGPENPKPRWEKIHDAVFGQGRGLYHRGENERFNLHRDNPIFTGQNANGRPGYILEIELNVQELYFRRLTVGMVAHALEQNASRLIRVTSSSAKLGLIYVYFNFQSIPAMKIFDKGTIPDYINEDPFKFALENVVYRELKGVKISGIPNLTYFGVKSNRNGLIVNFPDSYLELSNPNRRAVFSFKDIQVISWGMSPEIIKEYILVSLSQYAIKDHDFNFVWDDDNYQAMIDTGGLTIWDEKSESYKSLSMAELQTAMMTTQFDVLLGYVINRNQNGLPKIELVRDGDMIDLKVEINPKFLITGKDTTGFYGLDLVMDDIGNVLAMVYSGNSNIEGVESFQIFENVVLIKNYQQQSDIAENETFQDYFLKKCFTLLINSQRLERASKRLFYVCEGRNFPKILSHPLIDSNYSRTDASVDVYHHLGVESSRTILVKEIRESVGGKLNPVHIDLMADSLTARTPKNKPLAQEFYGNSAKGTEFLARSFQKSTDTLMKSYGSSDHLRSFIGQIVASRLANRSVMNQEEKDFILSDPDIFGIDYPVNRAKFNTKTGLVENVGDEIRDNTTTDEPKLLILGNTSPRAERKGRRGRGRQKEIVVDDQSKIGTDKPYAVEIYKNFEQIVYHHPHAPRKNPGTIHYGQRKLFIGEVMFLTDTDAKYCVYAGAAAGIKAAWLAKLFPKMIFILIDPNEFRIKPVKGIKITTIRNISEVKGNKSNIIIYQNYMTWEIADKLKDLNSVFISDIRTAIFGENDMATDEDIVYNSIQQYNWVVKLQPKKAMLKFRHPYRNEQREFKVSKEMQKEADMAKDKIDFIKDYKEGKFKYFKADIAVQAWVGDFSSETRLITDGKELEYLEKPEVYEGKMFYYNMTDRQEYTPMINTGGLDGCGDCRIELDVWTRYIKKFGGDLEYYLRKTQEILQPLHFEFNFKPFKSREAVFTNVYDLGNTIGKISDLRKEFFSGAASEKINLLDTQTLSNNPYLTKEFYESLVHYKEQISPFFAEGKEAIYKKASEEIAPKEYAKPEEEKLIQILTYYEMSINQNTNFLCVLPQNKDQFVYMLEKGASGVVVSNSKAKPRDHKNLTVIYEQKETSKMLEGAQNLMDIAKNHRDKTNFFLGMGFVHDAASDEQELYNAHLIMREIVLCLFTLNSGGTMIIRVFDLFTQYSSELLYLCTFFFDELSLIKPRASKPQNAEKFLVGRGFKRPDGGSFLYDVLGRFYQQSIELKESPSKLFVPGLIDQDALFKVNLEKMTKGFMEFQRNTLKSILAKARELSNR